MYTLYNAEFTEGREYKSFKAAMVNTQGWNLATITDADGAVVFEKPNATNAALVEALEAAAESLENVGAHVPAGQALEALKLAKEST